MESFAADGEQVQRSLRQPLPCKLESSEFYVAYLNLRSSKGKGKGRPSRQDFGPASESSEEDALETIQEEHTFEGWPL